MDVTAYAMTRAVDLPFDEIVECVTAALATEGFGLAANPALEPLAAARTSASSGRWRVSSVLVALAAGLLLGLALGTVGGGGAVLAVPVLIYLLGQSVHAATAESLLVVVGAAAAGAIGHARHGTVCWQLAGAFAAAAIPGSIVGTVANRGVSAEPLLSAFAILLLGVAVMTWRRAGARAGVGDGVCPPIRLAVVAGLGMSVGLLTGLFGVGGGFAVVPALALGLRVPIRRAIATSLVIVTGISAVGFRRNISSPARTSRWPPRCRSRSRRS